MLRRESLGLLCALSMLAAVPLGARGEEPAAIDEGLAERIDNLVLELDADEFQMRELASRKLAEIGEPARARLSEVAAKPSSAEVRIRVNSLLRLLDIAALRRNALKLDDFYEHARQAGAGDLDSEKLELQLERLIAVMREATGSDTWNLPVKLADVKLAAADDSSPRNSLVIIKRRGEISSVRDSIVLADMAVDISSVRNSIVIARIGASVSSVDNSLIIAGYEVAASHANNNSILLSGGTVQASIPRNSILGAGERADVSIGRENLVLVNTPFDDRRGAPRLVKTEGLILRSAAPPADNPLADKIVVTAALGDVVLFRRTAHGGELVARLDQPIVHPDGGELPETAGWQACFTSRRGGRSVIFTSGERYVVLPIAGR